MQTREWTGNVRELKNNVERIMILASGDPQSEITAAMLPSDVGTTNGESGMFSGEHCFHFATTSVAGVLAWVFGTWNSRMLA